MQNLQAIVPSIRTSTRGAFALALTVSAAAALANPTNGPVFPLPGGSPVTPSGFVSGSGTGRLNSYTIATPGAFTEAYWGQWGGTAILGSLNGPGGTTPMNLNVGASNFAGGIGIWNGTSNFTYLSGSSFVTANVNTRFTLTTTSGGNPLSLIPGASVGVLNSDLLANITGLSSFEANLLFEAQNPLNGNWTPLVDLYNSFNNNNAGTQTSFSGGFYYSVPTPSAAALLGLGGISALRRRRAKA